MEELVGMWIYRVESQSFPYNKIIHSDEGVPFCEDNQLRTLGRLIGSATTSAAQFARLFSILSAPRNFAVFVAKVTHVHRFLRTIQLGS